jgi:hypothetical protein
MTRRLLLLAALLGGCGSKQFPPDLFPQTASVWNRVSLKNLPPASPPDPVPPAAIKRILSASYQGAGTLQARAYLLTSSAVALDLVQRWKSTPESVFFYRDEYFIVVHWREADRNRLHDFVRVIEKRLDPQSGVRKSQ